MKDYEKMWNMLRSGLTGLRDGFNQIKRPGNGNKADILEDVLEYMNDIEEAIDGEVIEDDGSIRTAD